MLFQCFKILNIQCIVRKTYYGKIFIQIHYIEIFIYHDTDTMEYKIVR